MKRKIAIKNKRKTMKYLFVACLLAYPLLQWGVNWLYLNVKTVSLTFQRFNVATGNYEFWGLEPYKRVVRDLFRSDSALATAFKNSYRAIYLNLIITIISVFCSYCFYKKVPGEIFFRVVFMLPTIISAVVLTTLYRNLLSSEFGPLAKLVDAITGRTNTSYLSTENDYLWGFIEFYCIWMGLGNSVLLSSTAMFRIPKEVIESAMLDGVGFAREFGSIVLPLIMPTVSVSLLAAFLAPAELMTQPMLIALNEGEGMKYKTFAWYVFDCLQGSESGLIHAAVVGVIFTLINLPLTITVTVVRNKIAPDGVTF